MRFNFNSQRWVQTTQWCGMSPSSTKSILSSINQTKPNIAKCWAETTQKMPPLCQEQIQHISVGGVNFGNSLSNVQKFDWWKPWPKCSFAFGTWGLDSRELLVWQLQWIYTASLSPVTFFRPYASVESCQNLFLSSSLFTMCQPLHCGMFFVAVY